LVIRYWSLVTDHWLAILILLISLIPYLYNLTGWQLGDDEGLYLYQAWRISLGEVPYRDFLTPQLPVFLYIGASVFKLVGPSLTAIRAVGVIAILATGSLIYLVGRRVFSAAVGLVALALFLANEWAYHLAREYRNEPYMLLFSIAAIYLFIRSFSTISNDTRFLGENECPDAIPGRAGLAIAGVLLGLATVVKLFGALPLAGSGLYIIYLTWRRDLSPRDALKTLLWLGVPYTLTIGAIMGAFFWISPNFFDATIVHHLRQDKGRSPLEVVFKGLALYLSYLTAYPVLTGVALVGAVRAVRNQDRLRALFAFQVPTILAFLVLARDLGKRHLVYLVPTLVLLFASFAVDLSRTRLDQAQGKSRLMPVLLSLLLGIAAVWPMLGANFGLATRLDPGTPAVAEYVRATTAPEDVVLSDNAGLNFYALRRSTYSGASLSSGAAGSGQISGRDLIRQIEQTQAALVLMQNPGGKLAWLRDYLGFRSFVQTHFHYEGTLQRTEHWIRVYRRGPPQLQSVSVDFGHQLRLSGFTIEDSVIETGSRLFLVLSWQAQRALDQDYVAFVHLVDSEGNRWGIRDQLLGEFNGQPTSTWTPGDTMLEPYVVQVTPGAPLGRYEIRVGLYFQGDQAQRLDWFDPAGAPHGQEYTLGTVELTSAKASWWVFAPQPIENEVRPERRFGNDAPLCGSNRLLEWMPLTRDCASAVALVGFNGVADRARPGDAVHLTAFWRALKPLPDAYQAWFQFIDAAANQWPPVYAPLASPSYPTDRWPVNDIVAGQYNIIVPGGAVAGRGHLLLAVADARGKPLSGEPFTVAEIEVAEVKRNYAVPNMQYPLGIQFGPTITLLGYDLPKSTITPGSALSLTLYWRAAAPVDLSYTVFTHLLDPGNRIRGQQDSVPVSGARPTTGWAPGEVITDPYELLVQSDAPPGMYTLEVGLYDPRDGQRLPVSDTTEMPGLDHWQLADVRVVQR